MTRRTGTASEARRSGRASKAWRSPSSSRGRYVNAAGVWRRWRGLSREISVGVVGCPSSALVLFVGWEATVAAARSLLTAEKSAEAVLCAGRRVLLAGESPVGPIPSGVRSQRRG
jgi:hypothetical protein